MHLNVFFIGITRSINLGSCLRRNDVLGDYFNGARGHLFSDFSY